MSVVTMVVYNRRIITENRLISQPRGRGRRREEQERERRKREREREWELDGEGVSKIE